MGLHRVGHDWSDLAVAAAATTIEPVFQSLGASATEPKCSEARAPQQEKPPQQEVLTHSESSPCSLQLEKSLHSNEEPAQLKIDKFFF